MFLLAQIVCILWTYIECMNTNEIDLDRSERLASKIIAMVRQK